MIATKTASSLADVSLLCIRRATLTDLDPLENCINTICREGKYLVASQFVMPPKWREILAADGELDRNLILVVEVNEQVVGYARLFTTAETSDHVAELGMGLIPHFRNQGIGSRVLAYILEWAKAQGFRKVTLGVFASNERAIHLYEKFGFIIEGRLKRQHHIRNRYVDELLMARFLG